MQSYTSGAATPKSALQPEYRVISGVTAGWTSGIVHWYYNADGEPTELRGRVQQIVAAAGAEWSAHCAVRFVYAGTTNARPIAMDGLTVIGWDASQPYSGLTIPQVSGGQLVEAGIEMNPGITRDPGFAAEVLVHELGHVLGLDHSNDGDAVMAGPPLSSYSYATRLDEDDVLACQALYDNTGCTTPRPVPQSSTVACAAPLVGTRTLRQTSVCSNHVWTLNPPTVVSDDCTTVATPPVAARPAADVLVKEYYRAGNDDYFMTASPAEQALLDGGTIAGWQATGHAFAAWSSPVAATNPVCRFFGNWRADPATGARIGPDTHFYTSDADECAYVPVHWPVWILETRSAFHVLPAAGGGCAPGSQPVWRLFRPSALASHRYVSDAGIATQFAEAGWIREGVAFCTPSP